MRHNDAALSEGDDVALSECFRLCGLDEDEIADLDMILRRAAHRAGLDSQRRNAQNGRRGIGRERAFNYNSKIADQQQGKDDAQHETDDLNCGYTAGFPAGIYMSVFSQGTTSEDGQKAVENTAKNADMGFRRSEQLRKNDCICHLNPIKFGIFSAF